MEEVEIHHLFFRLHDEVGPLEHKNTITHLHDLVYSLGAKSHGIGRVQRKFVKPGLQRLCQEEYVQARDSAQKSSKKSGNTTLYPTPKLMACLMGAIGGYHGHRDCVSIENGQIRNQKSVPCTVLVRCGISADQSHNGKIDHFEQKPYAKCLQAHGVSPEPRPGSKGSKGKVLCIYQCFHIIFCFRLIHCLF